MTWAAIAGAASQVVQETIAFTPTQITGLKVWLDANDLTTLFQDSAKTTPVAADTDPVGAWADKSGSSNDVKQATAGSRPAYRTNIKAGKPALLFDGTADHLKSAAFSAALSQPITIFVVVHMPSSASGILLAVMDGISSGNRVIVTRQSVVTGLRINAGTSLDSTETLDKWLLWTSLFNGASGQFWLNGVSEATGAVGANTLTGLTLGTRFDASSSFFNSYIAEVLIYNALLSDSNRGLVESYLSAKWGFL